MGQLRGEVLPIESVTPELQAALFALFARHYQNVSASQFANDLAEKDFLILLRDKASGEPRGFSTQQLLPLNHRGEPVRVLFSGDTIIDRQYWGEQELVRAWCRFAGSVLGGESGRLFWFLISKGYRTYLYLPLFFRAFMPRPDGEADEFERTLRERLGREKFGADYDAARGVAAFAKSRGHLAPGVAEVPPARAADPHVAFFLHANPGWARGDELACLAEIAPANMRGLARRALLEGLESHASHQSHGSHLPAPP